MNKTTYVGLDVHKDTIAVAVAEEGRRGYGLHRHLTKLGFDCAVVAPAQGRGPGQDGSAGC